jgi:hypothetical protein
VVLSVVKKNPARGQESMIRKRVFTMILAVLVIALEAMAKATRALIWLH